MDHLCCLCFVLVMLSCSFISALRSSAGKWLTSWLACTLSFLVFFVTFSYGVLDQVWYLNVSIPDLCLLAYFVYQNFLKLH